MSEARDSGTNRRSFLKVAGIAAAGAFAITRLIRSAWAGERPRATAVPTPTEAPDTAVEWSPEVGWSRFTNRARRIVFFAQEEAAQRGENEVGTEHLLLGLVRENDSVAARILDRLGLSLGRIRSDIERQMRPNSDILGTEMQLTPTAKRAINLTFEEARQLNSVYIGTEHLLLGLIREGNSPAARLLVTLGAEPGRVRREVVRFQTEAV